VGHGVFCWRVSQFLGEHRIASIAAKHAGGKAKTGGCLFAFILLGEEFFIEGLGRVGLREGGEPLRVEGLGGASFIDELTQERVKEGIGGQVIFIFLLGCEFCRWRAGQDGWREGGHNAMTMGLRVILLSPMGESIDMGFIDIFEGGEASAHITIEGGIAHGQFGLISCGEEEAVFHIGAGHKERATDTRLEILCCCGGGMGRGGTPMETPMETPMRQGLLVAVH